MVGGGGFWRWLLGVGLFLFFFSGDGADFGDGGWVNGSEKLIRNS